MHHVFNSLDIDSDITVIYTVNTVAQRYIVTATFRFQRKHLKINTIYIFIKIT